MRLKQAVLIVAVASTVLPLGAVEAARLNVDTDERRIAPTEAVPLVSYADVIGEAAPSVVSVYTIRRQNYPQSPMQLPGGLDLFFRHFGHPGQVPMSRSCTVSRLRSRLGSIPSADGYF